MTNRPVKVRQGTSGPLLRGDTGQVATQDGLEDISMQDASGGSGAPLSNVFYVDAGTVAASPDGSIGSPFPTGNAGVTALNDTTRPGTLYFTPSTDLGGYVLSAAATVDTAFVGMNSNELDLISRPSALFSGTVTGTGKLCYQNLTFADGAWESTSTTGDTEIDGCHIGQNAVFDAGETVVIITNSFVDSGVVVNFVGETGTLYLDVTTNYWWNLNSGTVNNGVVVVMDAGTGDITPLTAALVADRDGAATTPTGAYSGNKAYNGTNAIVNAVTALAGASGGGISLAPGTYNETLDVTGFNLAITGLGTPKASAFATMVAILAGTLTLGGSEPASIVKLSTLNLQSTVSGNGELTIENGTTSVGTINGVSLVALNSTIGSVSGGTTPIAGLISRGSSFFQAIIATSGEVQGSTFNAACHFTAPVRISNSIFNSGAIQTDDAANVDNSSFLDAATVNLFIGGASTVSQISNSNFSGVTQFGDGITNVYSSTFRKAVATTAPGTLKMYGCIYDTSGSTFSLSSSNLFLDGTSERNALLAGVDITVVIHALSVGQGGDALKITSTDQTVDFTAQTRGYLSQNTLTADHTFKIQGTGKVDNAQIWIVDNYNRTAHTLTVQDDTGATIETLGTVAAGTALRYTFGLSQTTGKIVLVSIQKL